MLENEEVVRIARQNLEDGERLHKKVNVREIMFGFNDGSISTLALLAGVTGGALARSQILIAGFSGVVAGAISMAIGAYISSKSEIEYQKSEIEREKREVEEIPKIEREEIRPLNLFDFFNDKSFLRTGFNKFLNIIIKVLRKNSHRWSFARRLFAILP